MAKKKEDKKKKGDLGIEFPQRSKEGLGKEKLKSEKKAADRKKIREEKRQAKAKREAKMWGRTWARKTLLDKIKLARQAVKDYEKAYKKARSVRIPPSTFFELAEIDEIKKEVSELKKAVETIK